MTSPSLNSKKNLFKNTGALFSLQAANYVLPFLIIPYLTQKLGVELYGVVAFGLAIVQISCVITDFGFNYSATYRIAKNHNNRQEIRSIVGAVTFCKLALVLPILLGIYTYSDVSGDYKEHSLFLTLLALPILGQTLQPIWLFQGIERMGLITLYTILSRSSYLLFTLILVQQPADYYLVAISNGIAQGLGAIIGLIMCAKLGYSPRWPGLQYTIGVFRESVEYFWARAAVSTYTAGGAFFLGIFSTPSQVAVYSAAEQLYKGAQALFQPVSQALYPYMAKSRNLPLFFKIVKAVCFSSLVGLVIGVISGKEIISIIFGSDFEKSYEVLIIFLLTYCVTMPSILLGYPLLGALGDSRSANYSVIYAGFIQILLLSLLIFFNHLESIYVALSVLLVETFVLVYRSVRSKRLITSIRSNNEPA
ncbi:oligosaccharide flippase family protein [Pseudomonas citronellolis]|uniref:oligosaccharide flippase family protein n=1 Tax=Pseudomonas citronellolis TaxID=53408 RepID=UPI00264A10D0|nr:oligosaccharide flippase family protein [Pseudomonas citronellolis]MDN6871698.1 oligosaccharide flippase family protein [Pseudomonas citronellolis]